jgi:hypothetical protein
MNREVAWSWPPQPPEDGRPEPIFIFAWPGSGRRQLLAALNAHAGLSVTDDEVRAQSGRRECVGFPRGAQALSALTEGEQLLARRRYWKLARRATDASDTQTVDAMWLSAEALPTVYRLFPQAKVIVLRRDPRDMALSWLRSGFTGQDEMAKVYHLQLGLLAQSMENVPLNYVELNYEDLASDPSGTLHELASGLEVMWDPAMLEAFEASPMEEMVESGSWEHYETWLQPMFAALEGVDTPDQDVLW